MDTSFGGLCAIFNLDPAIRFSERLADDRGNVEVCLWMSFYDTDRPPGQQFNGVIISRTCGLAHAIKKTWETGINPGGQIHAYTIDAEAIAPKHFDRLLTKHELIKFGYCDA